MTINIIESIRNKFFPLTMLGIKGKEEKELNHVNYKGEIKYSNTETPYELAYGTYRYYINETHGNKDLTFDEAKYKLSSNALSGVKMEDNRDDVEIYRYGNLVIKIIDEMIVYIKNYNGRENKGKYRLKIDFEYRDYLRELWGVSDK